MPQSPLRVLTGITPSGTPHIGNYAGAMRPAIAASQARGTEAFYFLSDLHSLITAHDPARVQRSTLEVAATWLAAGLDPDKVWFYRQSDIPEITELMWFLTCMAGKGQLNRAHAYKAAVDKNHADGLDEDAGISAGLFLYPVLMAADILIFKTHKVPVGRDQVQHIEMARDFAQRFNHVYDGNFFVLPEAAIDEHVATLSGLDGRKMSKSYDNVIPLFAEPVELKRLIFSILTDSRAPGEPKQTQNSVLFQLYQAFASAEQTLAFAQAFADGIGWGEAKAQVFALLDAQIAPMRERYRELMAKPHEIEEILRAGAQRLRERYAIPFLAELREAVGLRDLSQIKPPPPLPQSNPGLSVPVSFKQYRERDGQFYFKLVQGDRVLLQSHGFATPHSAGQVIAALKRGELGIHQIPGDLGPDVSAHEVQAALNAPLPTKQAGHESSA